MGQSGKQKQIFMKKKSFFLTVVATLSLASATIAQTVPNYVPTNGLVGWWPFNGNANDESGNNNNGTVNGATLTSDRFGNANKAYSFDGVNDYVEIFNSSSLNYPTQAITISTWFKINSWFPLSNGTSWFPILSKSNSNIYGNYRLGLGKDNQNIVKLYGNLNSVGINENLTFNLNQWNNLIFIINASNNTTIIYLNNSLVYQGVTSPTGWNTNNTLPLIIGMDSPGFIEYSNGFIDDIGIWNRALTASEVTELYNAGTGKQYPF